MKFSFASQQVRLWQLCSGIFSLPCTDYEAKNPFDSERSTFRGNFAYMQYLLWFFLLLSVRILCTKKISSRLSSWSWVSRRVPVHECSLRVFAVISLFFHRRLSFAFLTRMCKRKTKFDNWNFVGASTCFRGFVTAIQSSKLRLLLLPKIAGKSINRENDPQTNRELLD